MPEKALVCSIYFGAIPEYAELSIQSMKSDKGIDWIIFGDDPRLTKLSGGNVSVELTSLVEIRRLFSAHLGTDCLLKSPYKLCDYKPLYYVIMDSFLNNFREYKWWGYCDLDTIFGRASHFFRINAENVDRVYDLGHLSILRSETQIFSLIERSAIQTGVTESERILGFDEHHGINRIFDNIGIPQKSTGELVADIMPHEEHIVPLPPARFYSRSTVGREEVATYIYYIRAEKLQRKEVAYIHFQKRNFLRIADTASFLVLMPEEIRGFHSEEEHAAFVALEAAKTKDIAVRVKHFRQMLRLKRHELAVRSEKSPIA